MATLPCATAIEAQLDAWGAAFEVLRAPTGIDGRPAYRIATERLGAWATLEPPWGGDPRSRLSLASAERVVTLTFDGACRATRAESPGPGRGVDVFDDRDLELLLERHPSAMIYLWSPHLPLSVDGYREAAAAAASRGLGFAAVVHPSSDRAFVEEAAEAAGIPPEARRPLSSVELSFRDLAVHAPAILVYVDGRAQSPLPGYRSAAGYLEYLDALLADRRTGNGR